MTRSHAGTARRHTRRRHRFASVTGLVALLGALFVTGAAPAHALSPCTASDPYCPFGVTDNYSVNFGQKLTVDAAHGLLANDHAPADTRIEFGGCTDTSSFWTDASFAVKSDGSFTYTPAPNEPYSGIDTLEYCIIDPAGDDDFGIDVNINVIATARNDSYGARVNTPLNVGEPGLVANDSGIDPAAITLDTTSAHGGTITDNQNGAFLYTPPTNFLGADTFGYKGWDLDGDFEYSATATIYIDGTPPVATMSAPGPVTLNTKVPVAWSATDPGGATASGIASYDEQYKIAAWNGPFGAFTPLKTTVAKSDTVAGTYGRTFCFHVRAKDRAGNYSPFTALRCTSVPLRARSLSYTAMWKRPANAAYFSGEAETTNVKGQSAQLPAVQAQHMWLVVTKCATCGSVQVRWNNVTIANVNLASRVTVHHALVPIAAFAAPRAGTLRLIVTSPNGRAVIIEALAVLRS